MSVNVVKGATRKPASSQELANLLGQREDVSGQLFIGYPIVPTPDGPYSLDALLVSDDSGIVVFDLIEGSDLGDYQSRQDDAANLLESSLRNHRDLMDRRKLRIPIHTVSFSTRASAPVRIGDGYPIVNQDTIVKELKKFKWPRSNLNIRNIALSAIEGISTIRKGGPRRNLSKQDSRGAKLKRLEDSIATLDPSQSAAVIQTVEGVQRIRGLAGSGKTIVLALKAAYWHAQYPDWRIAVTFSTRSLKGQFRRLINHFYIAQTREEPNWDNLRVMGAWGAPGGADRDGVYYEFCRENGVEYFDYSAARDKFGPNDTFTKVCQYTFDPTIAAKPLYDAILIDEAQDLSPSFLRICYSMMGDEHKRLVYAYDELQNLSGESLPSPDLIFEEDSMADDEPARDIILNRCYRNSRPVLVTAHALGFGIYRQLQRDSRTNLVQMFENPRLWTDVGYHVKDGELADNKDVSLIRTDETSPRFLEDHSSIDDLIQFRTFRSGHDQAEWLSEAIQQNLQSDEIRASDIIVINPDPITTRARVGMTRRMLWDKGIQTHLAGVDTDPDTFFKTGTESVTFTGIYRAKGNEAGIVYIINAQDCHSSAINLATIRNRLFTAITRSKSWVRVLGIGSRMEALKSEYNQLKENNFELKFTYPNAEQRGHLRIVHRDMSASERKTMEDSQNSLKALLAGLSSGTVQLEDLDGDSVARLKELLNG